MHEPEQNPVPTPGTGPSGPTRRTVLSAVGLAGVGVVALAGCGADDAVKDAAGSATDSARDAVGRAIDEASIPVGGGKIFADQKVVVTQPAKGEFKAFSAICTHEGCLVSEVANGTITCSTPCGHGSQFDAATGAVKAGPAGRPLPQKKVSIGTDGITVS
jgi:Rieske Fe-S protein